MPAETSNSKAPTSRDTTETFRFGVVTFLSRGDVSLRRACFSGKIKIWAGHSLLQHVRYRVDPAHELHFSSLQLPRAARARRRCPLARRRAVPPTRTASADRRDPAATG